jgi:tetratricopeptide (TPR) repeat protein
LGIIQRHLSRNAEAIRSLNKAIEIDSQNGRAYMGLGDVYFYGTSEYQKAIDAYTKGLEYDTDNHVAEYNIGYSYNDLGNYNQALEYLAKALKADTSDYDAYVETGYAQRKLKNETEAMAAYQKALQLKPGSSSALFGIGDVYFEIEKKYTTAADFYRRGLTNSPDSPTALYRLGYAYNDSGNYSDAVDVLTRAHKLKPQWATIMEELGYSYKQLKRYDDATTILKQAVTASRDADLAHYYLGQVYVSTGNKSGANNEYRELQRLNSEYTDKLMDMIRKM